MNRKLTDTQITEVFSALVLAGRATSGRAVRAELRLRYGAAGKTARVFALCRSLRQPPASESARDTDLLRRLTTAEAERTAALQERDSALARAERSELREIAHQDRWANEIHELRQAVQELSGERLRRQGLDELVQRLQRELQSLQRRLARYER